MSAGPGIGEEAVMRLDVRSLWDWVRDVVGRGRLSGGGALGTPWAEETALTHPLGPRD